MKRLLILCLFLVGGLFQVSASAMSFHERECKESFDGKAGSTGQWDHNCWDYVSEDGKRWIGSSGKDSQAGSDSAKPDPEIAVRLGGCDDLICGRWVETFAGGKKTVVITKSRIASWDFEQVIVDPKSYAQRGYEIGMVNSRFNRINNTQYVGEQMIRRPLQNTSMNYVSIVLIGKRNATKKVNDGQRLWHGSMRRLSPVPTDTSKRQGGSGVSSGTGFFINHQGYLITNNHVIDGCETIKVVQDGVKKSATLVSNDSRNDLAILKVPFKVRAIAKFRGGRNVRTGADLFALGFPLEGTLSDTLKITKGMVNSLAGLNNDTRMMQISTPVQPGNSGGPLLDQAGNVVGVVTAKMNALKMAKYTGDIPQNVNFALKASLVRDMLEVKDIDYETASSKKKIETVDIFDKAKKFTVLVECLQ